MDRRSSSLEELPPLELRALRDLDLAEPPGEGQPAHVSSASGVVRRGDFVYVIGDDLLFLGVFRLSQPSPGTLRRVFAGEAGPGDHEKPDLEVLTLLPPFLRHPYGALLGLGSGSAPRRDRGFVWALAADGSLRGEPAVIDLQPLYALLGERIDGLNVEGACVMGDRLWLLHRGNRGSMTNVVAELSLAHVMRSLAGDRTVDVHELAAIRAYDLGELDGVALTFSDAAPLGGEILAFCASAEAQPQTRDRDRRIRGSVVGTIDLDGRVRRLRTIDRRFKVEGIHASLETGVMDFLFVCDQDDPNAASPLLSAAMPVDGRLERDDAPAGAGERAAARR
ncbi:MAG TPA: hypothetical protein VHF51_18950 [Solirubrobacteraceae bacterium]|nr:hypothetical protein [Solirubrobacteraceae bacterium]